MAEALAAGLALEAAKAGIKLVTGRMVEEIALVWGFKDHLKILQNRFTDIQAFLEDLASAKYAEKSKFVNLWLTKLTDVAYSADELMDDYEYELLRRKIELNNNRPSFNKRCSNFISLATNSAVFRIRMSHRVREILFKLDELDNEAMKNGLQKVQLAREAVASSNAVGYYVNNVALQENRKYAAARGSEFIGRKSDEEKLLQMILNPTRKDIDCLSTVAIVGIGGLGKSTLAWRLYEHESVDVHFGRKIWICVSEDFKVDRLLNEMVENLTSSKCDLTNTGGITKKLEELLKGNKFFLVLDDVWEDNQDSWNSFKNALLSIGEIRGCVILITTRRNDVAEKAHAFYRHKLPGLSEDEGWALLQQRVFSETRPYDSSFDNVGRRIVNKCKGVPLAIKAIGGTLQSKKYVYEWESIENSEMWGSQPEDVNNILPSLLLSYNLLNHVYVKQCFAHCAIFPKGYQMRKCQLITLWLAQGFLHGESATSSSTLTMELIGEKYFNIFLNYSFLEKEKDSYYNQTVYKMHDLVHDLAAYVSKNLLVWKVGIKLVDDVSHVRHLVFDLSKNEPPCETSTLRSSMRKIRTISFWDNVWIDSTLGCARYMRTLIIAETGLEEVPYIIGQLVHLRYLDLSHNPIGALPESICKLYQLQTLRIVGCSNLPKLPGELHRLRNIRHIETGNYLSASTGLRQLTNLQTLPPLYLRDSEGWSIDELGPLDQLKGNIKIGGLEHVKNKELARQAGLGRKHKIVKLHLWWRQMGGSEEGYQKFNDEDVLDSFEPHPNLQSLCVDGFKGVSFPLWIMTMVVKHGGHLTPLTNLKEVRLTNCWKIQQLPTLGQLPFLRMLWLEGFNKIEFIGEAFYNVDGTTEEKVLFGSLRELHIIYFARLTTWMPPSAPIQAQMLFSKIETLEIRECPELERVPCFQFQSLKYLKLSNVGGRQPLDIIKYSPALQSLELSYMKNMTMIPEELSNLEKLIISHCESVKCIPSDLVFLKELEIRKCRSLACIPDGLSSLRKLYLWDCKGLERMPKSLEEATSLESIRIHNCPLIKGPIPDLGKLQNLEHLILEDTGELLTCSLQCIPNLHRLQDLTLSGDRRDKWDFNLRDEWDFNLGDSRDEWDFNLTFPQSLRRLTLIDFPNVKSLPQLILPSTLQFLRFERFDELEQLPEWIGNLSSLETLWLWSCKKFKYLPSQQALSRLPKLSQLYINGCPILQERCDEDVGPENVFI